MNYQIEPLHIGRWTDLDDFDEYEAKAIGWSQETITAALREIQCRELDTNDGDHGEIADYGRPPRPYWYGR